MDCSLPSSSAHAIFQARILEWVAIPFSRGSFQPRDWTWVSCIAGRFFTVWTTRRASWRTLELAKCHVLIEIWLPSIAESQPPSWETARAVKRADALESVRTGLQSQPCTQRLCLQCRKLGFDLWVGKIPWRRGWLPTLVFLPWKPHG